MGIPLINALLSVETWYFLYKTCALYTLATQWSLSISPTNVHIRISAEYTVTHLRETFVSGIVLETNMGPIWGRQDPGGPHVGPLNFVIWDGTSVWPSAAMTISTVTSQACSGITLKVVKRNMMRLSRRLTIETMWNSKCNCYTLSVFFFRRVSV